MVCILLKLTDADLLIHSTNISKEFTLFGLGAIQSSRDMVEGKTDKGFSCLWNYAL